MSGMFLLGAVLAGSGGVLGLQSHSSEVRNQAAFAYVRWTATPKPVMRPGLDRRVGRVVGRLARNA